MATHRTCFLILLAAANVAIADDGDQKNKDQPARRPAIQGAPAQGPRRAAPAEAPRRVLPAQAPRGAADTPRRVVPSQGTRGETPRRIVPGQGPRGSDSDERPRRVIPSQAPRGSAPVETPRRVTPAEAQRRTSPPRGGFESTPSMSRTRRLPSQGLPRSQVKAESRGAARQEAQKFLQSRRREVRTPQVSQDQQAVKKALPKQIERDRQAAANVNTRIKKYRPNYHNTFNDSFFDRHHHHPAYYHRGIDWWRPYPWIVINNFLGFGWAYPVYFDVAGYPIPIGPEVGYIPQVGYGYAPDSGYVPAEAVPVETQGDWLSLGVFVAARSEEDAAYSPMFVQLAINKEGDLEGTYYNAARDQIYPLDGLVDRESQQAVWKMSEDPDSPIMTTGLFNLTQDVAPIQIHFSDGSEQSWVLVRLNR